MENRKLDTRSAGAWLGVSPATLATWRVRGGGPQYIKLGRRAVYELADLERFVLERKRNHTADPGPTGAN